MSHQDKRKSSEYSMNSNIQDSVDKIEINPDEQKAAQSHLYKILFSDIRVKLTLIPSFLLGFSIGAFYLIFAPFTNTLAKMYMIPGYDPMPECINLCLYMVIIAVANGIFKFFDSICWIQAGSALSVKIRKDLFNNMMRCEVQFFDVNPIGGIITLISEDAKAVQEAFGTVKGTQVQNLGQFLTGTILTFVYSWKIGLIFIASCVLIGLVGGAFMPGIAKNSEQKFQFSSKMMTYAEESLSAIRTVRGYNQEEAMNAHFTRESHGAMVKDRYVGTRITLMIEIIMVIIWASLLGNFYYAATMVDKGTDGLEIGDLFAIFGFCMMGNMGMMTLLGSSGSEAKALTAGARILKLAAYKPEIQYEGGLRLDELKGNIVFENVSFKYPTRDAYVLKNVSFEVKPNEITAFVGHSGSGKSTIIQLIERFYDVTEGIIYVDGHDIKTLDPRWLHEKIALVAQEPTLFQTSIKANIMYGARDATDEQLINAAEIANAMKFINKLPNKFEETVGEKGMSMSGGQKQRIAIARAVIRDPAILLTDEATSALDAGSEKKVQIALDSVMKGRTSIVVAHRLSTIRNANIIYVFESGEIKESGTHEELIEKKGVYHSLVSRQLNEPVAQKKSGKVEEITTTTDEASSKEEKSSSSSSSDVSEMSDVESD